MKLKLLRFATALFLPLFFTACGEKIEPGTTPAGDADTVQATVARAAISQQPFIYEAVGTVTARTASTVSSKLMGVVRTVHVREGDRVKKGDLLVTIDQRQVQAQLESALANANVAEKEYQRYKQLLEQQSASQQEFDRAEAQYRQAQAAVAAARVGKKDARVRAPYDGRVVMKMISEGDLASPGTPFVTIEEEGAFNAELVLPERHIQAVREGMAVNVTVPALGDQVLEGDIGRIIPSADARSRSFQVKVYLETVKDLRSGMFARVAIPLGGAGRLLIPKTAVVQQGQLDGVFIVDDTGIARFRLVRIGKRTNEQVEIVSGLQPDQRFVAVVPLGMRDGLRVEG